MTLEEIIKLLEKSGIKTEYINKDKHDYSRTIDFKVYGIDYRIVWFCNHSTLEIGTCIRPACIPFKYCYFDTSYPLVGGNKSVGFSYKKYEQKNRFDRVYPYEVFRIPVEL